MMQIIMLRTAAGPDGVFLVGKRYNVKAELAKRWVDANVAKYLRNSEVETAAVAPAETATRGPGRPRKLG